MENTIKFSALTAEQQAIINGFHTVGYIDDHANNTIEKVSTWEKLAIFRRNGKEDLVVVPRDGNIVTRVCLNKVYMDENNKVHLSRQSIGGVYCTYEDYSDNIGGEVIHITR